MKKPNARIMRWLLHLQQFRFDVQYRPGRVHQNADGLSRFSVDPAETVSKMEDVYVIYAKNFVTDEWISAQAEDPFCISVKNRLDESTGLTHQNYHKSPPSYLHLENGLLAQADGKIVVPKSKVTDVFKRFHDHAMEGHHGVPKSLHRIQNRLIWPSLVDNVCCSQRR